MLKSAASMDPRSQRVGETGHIAPCQNVTGLLCSVSAM